MLLHAPRATRQSNDLALTPRQPHLPHRPHHLHRPPLPAQVISTARTCNLILIILDCLKPLTHKRLIEHELEGFGIRLNKQPPKITFKKKDKGGITFSSNINNPRMDIEAVKAVCSEYRWAAWC